MAVNTNKKESWLKVLKKNDVINLTITDITNEASGVGRYESMAVFVPGAAVGDELLVQIVKILKNYAFGIIKKILTPSPDRTEADCPVYAKCGGCSLRHITYEAECTIKESWVRENFRRIGKIDTEPEAFIPSPKETGYRNKALYPVALGDDGRVKIGFFVRRSHRVVDDPGCLLHPPVFGEIVNTVRDFLEEYDIPIYDESAHRGLVRHLLIRQGAADGQVMVCLVLNGTALPHEDEFVSRLLKSAPAVCSVILNENTAKTNVALGKRCRTIYGSDSLEDILCGVKVNLSPLAFYQVNHDGAEVLYRTAADFLALSGDETVLDLYCGAGTIGLSIARMVKEVIGVEIVPAAVENARKNARANKIQNARFILADAAAAAKQLADEGVRPGVVILDPPRKGCEKSLLETIVQLAPEKIAMISCNSATAARDSAILAQHGYAVKKLVGVDMFPRTAHVECVVLMEKEGELPR